MMHNLQSRLLLLEKETKSMKKDICAATGISLRGYNYICNGQRDPSISSVIALADYFDVSLDYLVGRSDDPTRR